MRVLLYTVLTLGLSIELAHAAEPTAKKGSETVPKMTTPDPQKSVRTASESDVADCIQMWDAGTHMSKQAWANTCRRVQNRLHQFDTQ